MTRYGTFIQPTDYCRKLPNSWPISEEGSVGVFPKVTVLCTQGLAVMLGSSLFESECEQKNGSNRRRDPGSQSPKTAGD